MPCTALLSAAFARFAVRPRSSTVPNMPIEFRMAILLGNEPIQYFSRRLSSNQILDQVVAGERFVEALWFELRYGNEPPPLPRTRRPATSILRAARWRAYRGDRLCPPAKGCERPLPARVELRTCEGPTPSHQLATADSGGSLCARIQLSVRESNSSSGRTPPLSISS